MQEIDRVDDTKNMKWLANIGTEKLHRYACLYRGGHFQPAIIITSLDLSLLKFYLLRLTQEVASFNPP